MFFRQGGGLKITVEAPIQGTERLTAPVGTLSQRPESRARRWLTRFPRALPLGVFLAIIAITALSVYAIESNARERSRAASQAYAQSIAAALDRRGNSFSSYLRAGAALFSSAEDVTPQGFRQFAAELRLDQNYRGSEGIGWISTIDRSEIGDFMQREAVRQPDFPSNIPVTSFGRGQVAPVTYFYPDTARNRRVLGFDMYADPTRAAAMDEARRTVQPTASGRISVVQAGAAEAPGFGVFMPVYKPVPGSPSRARVLSGFVFSTFNAALFLDEAIDSAPPAQLGVRLYDGEDVGRGGSANLLVSRSLGDEGTDILHQPVRIANRPFLLVVEEANPDALQQLSMIALLFGLALASLLALVVRLLARQAAEASERLAFYEQQHSIRNSLTRELNHRVKNTLANVLSILSLTRRRADSLEEFATSLEGRIRALSATHDLLTESDWATTPISDVVEAELQHVVEVSTHDVIIEGPTVDLAPNDALSFGLAIHELATNAAKFGALSVPGGRVSVRWSLSSDTLAEVEWCESGGPQVAQERHRGFGTELIEKIVAHELKQDVELEFRPQGVRCVIRVPVRRRDEFQIRDGQASAPPA